MISGRTAVYAVVGQPVSHSLSPAMHNAAYAHLGMDAVEAMDYAVNRENKTPQQAARAWMAQNQSNVEAWFALH